MSWTQHRFGQRQLVVVVGALSNNDRDEARRSVARAMRADAPVQIILDLVAMQADPDVDAQFIVDLNTLADQRLVLQDPPQALTCALEQIESDAVQVRNMAPPP